MTQNLPAPIERTKSNSVMVRMAERFGMDRVAFERTLMATVVPGGKATPEQVAAVLLVAHRTGILNAADKMIVLRDGAIEMFGPRDEVAARLQAQEKGARPGPRPTVVSGG